MVARVLDAEPLADASSAAMSPELPSIHGRGVLEEIRADLGLQPHLLRRLRNALYKHGLPAHQALALLPPAARSAVARRTALATLDEVGRHDSSADGASKLLLRTRAGLVVETVVLRIRSGRSAVCVSSQVGCAVRCTFCATGHMGIVRNLGADDIVEQVAYVGQALRAQGRRLRNVVFMGMGEPMHNRAAVEDAVARLLDPGWFALSPRHVTVSTIGVADEIVRFVERFPEVNLALSLHAARPEVRARLMPHARTPSLAELRASVRTLEALRRRPLMVEYLLLDGVNDGADDAAALAAWCRGLAVHLNVIPYNPIDAAPALRPSPPGRQRAFVETLRAAGFTVTTRFSLGRDIAAACGQLARPAHEVRPSP
ncbi:MAG TPA: 23S rRNA (adenine(2503)-C(2))-methyltransferase RlmN [Candidatus Binatia bacterium]